MSTESTIQRILDAALELFSERGVGTVSTRAIADRAGVSSGNLHYHFENKSAIVRALLAQRYKLTEPIWQFSEGHLTLAGFEEMLRANLALAWTYRFLNRESVTLGIQDPEFRTEYAERYRRRRAQLREILLQLRDADLVALNVGQMEDNLTIGWIVSENWLNFLESTSEPTPGDKFADGARLIMNVLVSS